MILSEQRKAEMREYSKAYRAKQREKRAFSPTGEVERLKQMREYSAIQRALRKAATFEEQQMHLRAKEERKQSMKAGRAELSKERASARRIAKNRRKREQYAAAKPADWKDGRKLRTLSRPKPAPKQKPGSKPMTIATKRAVGRTFKTRMEDLSKKVRLEIPELRMTVFIDPGKDPEEVKKKYLKK